MVRAILCVFPSTLFPAAVLGGAARRLGVQEVWFVEEPMFFHDPKARPYLYSTVKLAYMRATMRSSFESFRRSRYSTSTLVHVTKYVDYEPDLDVCRRARERGISRVVALDPQDAELSWRMRASCRALGLSYEECTALADEHMYLVPRAVLEEYHGGGGDKRHQGGGGGLSRFYAHVRRALGVLEGVPSTDALNRARLPAAAAAAPDVDPVASGGSGSAKAFYAEAADYVLTASKFNDMSERPGPRVKAELVETLVRMYPLTPEGWRRRLSRFLSRSFHGGFARYQDAIAAGRVTVHHSVLAPGLNNGMLSPRAVLSAVLRRVPNQVSNQVSNDVEAFVRQLLGWREYMRYVYLYLYVRRQDSRPGQRQPTIRLRNEWGHTGRLNFRAWYGRETTGLPLLDAEIRKVLRTGYSHHIVRLMVHLNAMVLTGTRPRDVIRWMSEVYVDANPVFMISNVMAMGHYDRSLARKPYIASAAYLRRMSDYVISQEEEAAWRGLFRDFLRRHRAYLVRTPYARNMPLFTTSGKRRAARSVRTRGPRGGLESGPGRRGT